MDNFTTFIIDKSKDAPEGKILIDEDFESDNLIERYSLGGKI